MYGAGGAFIRRAQFRRPVRPICRRADDLEHLPHYGRSARRHGAANGRLCSVGGDLCRYRASGFALVGGKPPERLALAGPAKADTRRSKKIIGLAIPGTIAASGTQINIMVSQLLASFEPGAKSWLFYADRLYQLPLGIVGVAVGVAILPRLARAARSDDTKSSNTLMDDGIGLAMALTLPAAIALMVAPAYLIEGLYTRGAFTLE